MYNWVRRTRLAWFVLGAYAGFSAVSAFRDARPLLALCRLFHVVTLSLNVILSDDLHNLDLYLGKRYVREEAQALEQQLHAHDWRAALTVPASYHLLLLLGIMDSDRVQANDKLMLVMNLGLYGLMCYRIAPERIAPPNEATAANTASRGRNGCCG